MFFLVLNIVLGSFKYYIKLINAYLCKYTDVLDMDMYKYTNLWPFIFIYIDILPPTPLKCTQ